MTRQWKKTAHKGLRYYDHPTRRYLNSKKKDRYYGLHFKVYGKVYDYGIGWWSDGIPDADREKDPNRSFEEWALSQLRLYKANLKDGSGIRSPRDKRRAAAEKEQVRQAERERLEKEAVTFGDFFEKTYLPQVKADRPRSARADEGLYNKWLKPSISTLTFSEISPFHIERLKKSMTEVGRAPRTVEYCLAIVRQVFNYAHDVGAYAGGSPTAGVKRPKIDNARMRYLTPKEADSLLQALKEKSTTVHDMALLSLHCGLRYGEIAGLQWQDVDLDKRALTIRDAKTGSRTTFMTATVAEMLKARAAVLDDDKGTASDFVFPARGEKKGQKPIMSQTYFRVVKDLGFNDGITDRKLKVTFHTLRHTHGTLLYEATHDLYLVQKSLGHKTGTMAQRYAKMTESRLRDAAQVMNEALQLKEDTERDHAAQTANRTK
jgi:integrase